MTAQRRSFRLDFRRPAVSLLGIAIFAAGCSYRVVGSARNLPTGVHSLGIPTFKNDTKELKVEQRITSAVLREFALRTRVPVNSNSKGVDAVLQGEIRNLSASPITFGSSAFASAFLVTIEVSVKLVRVKDGTVLWENPGIAFRGQYLLSNQVTEFFSEENAAIERLARDFADSLASTILSR
jgi:hypothetical protein